MATLKRAAIRPPPAGATHPMLPVYTPRGSGSRSRMICMVRTLGAPVIEAQGNTAFRIEEREASVRAATREVICHTVG